MADDGPGPWVKGVLTLLVVVMAIPGLIIEPGPLSELVALGAIGTIWGLDLGGDTSPAGGGGA